LELARRKSSKRVTFYEKRVVLMERYDIDRAYPRMIRRRTLTSQVIDYVLGMIKSGQAKPGDRLPTEAELTASLGVSRTCVREAMKSLESLRLITVRPKVGAVVLEPSPTALFNAEHLSTEAFRQQTNVLIEFRRILEIGLAPLAAEKATMQDLESMQAAMDEHRVAIATNRSAYTADMAFHKALARASKNPIAMMVLDLISEPLLEQRKMTNRVPHAAEDGLRDHARIYRAVKDRNPERAREIMREHMNTAEHYWRIAEGSNPDTVASTPQIEKRLRSAAKRMARGTKAASTA
jgi:GntR family transcriptional repressor for pyruvate dehydrogenase complex